MLPKHSLVLNKLKLNTIIIIHGIGAMEAKTILDILIIKTGIGVVMVISKMRTGGIIL